MLPYQKLYRITRKTGNYVWFRWDAMGSQRGLSHRIPLEEFFKNYSQVEGKVNKYIRTSQPLDFFE